MIERVNVEGTRNVIDGVRPRGARLVHTSTAGTCGPVPGREATEEDEPPAWELAVPYKRTKLAAERSSRAPAARRGRRQPDDADRRRRRKPTPTGRMIAGVATGRIRGFVATTGLNVVDVRDVARGHALALEHGAPGERYILGGANLPLEELFAAIADLARAPATAHPRSLRGRGVARRLGLANRDEVKLARLPMYFHWEKARDILGYRPGPVEPALARAVAEALNVDGKGGA